MEPEWALSERGSMVPHFTLRTHPTFLGIGERAECPWACEDGFLVSMPVTLPGGAIEPALFQRLMLNGQVSDVFQRVEEGPWVERLKARFQA